MVLEAALAWKTCTFGFTKKLPCTQARRKHFGSGAAIGTKKTAGGLGGAVSPPAGPGQSPGRGPGGEAPGSSVNLGILKP